MDQVLKARKLSSASARRKRMQARKEEEMHAQERYIEHKRRIMLYDHLAEEVRSPTDPESDDSSESSQHERGDSVTTSSDYSVVTPHDTPSAPPAFEQSQTNALEIATSPGKPQLHLVLPDTPIKGSQPSPVPKLQASLVALSDFTYDRYSMILDSAPPMASPEETMATPELDYDDDYCPSPVEIATPISISLPKTRPSVISISSRMNKKRRTITAQSPLARESRPPSPATTPPPTPPRSAKRLSSSSARSGFLASEAQPMEVPELPANASSIIASASRDSVAWNGSEDGKKAMQRKSSQPLLSAIKTNHARMSSIKSLIKSPTHNHSSSTSSSRPESRSSRPPTSTADVMNDDFKPFETVLANLYDAPLLRPHTSHQRLSRPSTSSIASKQSSVTALPPYLQSSNRSVSALVGAEPWSDSTRRKKSFSSLRKRSESISQAFKSATAKSTGTAGHTPKLSQHFDMPTPPPMPQGPLRAQSYPKESVELSSFPTPPLPSPRESISARSFRSRKSVASYSMFPSSPRIGNEVKSGMGLGLGLKV